MGIEYLKAFLYGVAFGVPFCLAVGPVFFFIIQVGVNKGVKYALGISYGVVLADLILINSTYFFIDIIRPIVINNYLIIESICIVILLCMGGYTLFKEVKIYEQELLINKTVFMFFINGLVLDVFNPSNIFVWIGVNTKIIAYNTTEHLLFYLSSLLTIAFLMIMLAVMSDRIRKYLNTKILKRVNVLLGLIYILIAISIIINFKSVHNLFL